MPHFVPTFNASWRDERRPYTMSNGGLDGALYLNFYGGVQYLNELYYQLPDTHCTKPIAIAKGAKTKNPQACGTKYQKSLINSAKKKTRKAAARGYCYNTPMPPAEVYFQCRYGSGECFTGAIAEAIGQAELATMLLALAVVIIATTCMGLPSLDDDGSESRYQRAARHVKGRLGIASEEEIEISSLGSRVHMTVAELFELLDTDKDGYLTRREVKKGAKALGLSPRLAGRLFDVLDKNGDGYLVAGGGSEADLPELSLKSLAVELHLTTKHLTAELHATKAALAETAAALSETQKILHGSSFGGGAAPGRSASRYEGGGDGPARAPRKKSASSPSKRPADVKEKRKKSSTLFF